MASETLPAWPDRTEYLTSSTRVAVKLAIDRNYERARADAAMARLRVAVEALDAIADNADKDGDGSCEPNNVGHGCYSPEIAMEALTAIGTLPDPTEGG